MAATTPKPELLDTITRRRRTVADFLETKNIASLQELNGLLPSLEKDYIVSEEFLKQCREFFSVISTMSDECISPSIEEKEIVIKKFKKPRLKKN